MIDDVCEVIFSKEIIFVLSIFVYVKSFGLGLKIMVFVQEMIVICEEVCDFLFEFLEVMVIYMRFVMFLNVVVSIMVGYEEGFSEDY